MNSDLQQLTHVAIAATLPIHSLLPRSARRISRWLLPSQQDQFRRERRLRLQEQRNERERIARELHDTLLQGFLGASLLLSSAVDQVPIDSSARPALSRVLHLMDRVVNEGRGVLEGLRSPVMSCTSLEHSLSSLIAEFAPTGARFRIVVTGKSKQLSPANQDQIFLIAREALLNAVRHSEATIIEVEIEYQSRRLRMLVRDNGRGMDPETVKCGRTSHWGLLGMRESAKAMHERLDIYSRPGLGTEVEVSLPIDCASDPLA